MRRHSIGGSIIKSGRAVFLRVVAAAVLMAGLWCFPAFADGWVQVHGQGWKYEESGGYATGWREIDGGWRYFNEEGLMQTGWVRAAEDRLWYCFDSETGVWLRRPVLDDTAVEKLLENELFKAGYYQYEDGETYITVDWRDGNMIYASIREMTGPNGYTTINMYKINKKSGKVDAAVGEDFQLYQ